MATQYQPITIRKFGRGMITADQPNTIPDDACVYSQNVEIGSDGSFAPRKGRTLFGQRTEAAGKILSTHTFKLRNGTEIPLRVRQAPATTEAILEWFNPDAGSSGEWELLKGSLDQTARWNFMDWNTTATDRCYMGNGVDAYRRWGGIVSSVVSNAATTITLLDSTNFPANGTVVVDGTEYAYTGNAANQLTGLVGVPALTAGEGVAIVSTAPTITATPGLSNIFIAHESRWWIAKGSSFYYSKSGLPEDFTVGTTPGSGGIQDFPEGGGDITGFISGDNLLVVLKRDVLRTFRFEQVDVATNEIPISRSLGFAPDIGPESSFSISSYLKETFYTSRNGNLRQLAQALSATQDVTLSLDLLDLTDDIMPTLELMDFSDAVTRVYDQKILLACKSQTDAAGNDVVIVYDRRAKGLVLYVGWNINDFFEYDGDLYMGSSTDPNTYKLFDGFTDDGGPIHVLWQSKQFDLGEPSIQKEMTLVYMEGLIGDGTEIEVTINLDEEGNASQTTRHIKFDGSYVHQNLAGVLGFEALGYEPLAGVTVAEDEDLNKFRVYVTVPTTKHYNFAIIVNEESEGGRFRLQTIAVNPMLTREPPATLKLST